MGEKADKAILEFHKLTNSMYVAQYKDQASEYIAQVEAGKNPPLPSMTVSAGAVIYKSSLDTSNIPYTAPKELIEVPEIKCFPAEDMKVISDNPGDNTVLREYSGRYNTEQIMGNMLNNVFKYAEQPITVTGYEELTESKIFEQCIKNYEAAGEVELPERPDLGPLVKLPNRGSSHSRS